MATAPTTASKKSAPAPSTASDAPQSKPVASLTPPKPTLPPSERPLSDVIGEAFPPFDHQTAVVRPFSEESARDAAFAQELSAMLLDVMLETHAWAAARPKHESQIAVVKYEKKISEVMAQEKQQEQTRERLNDFVSSMKNALAALTGLGQL